MTSDNHTHPSSTSTEPLIRNKGQHASLPARYVELAHQILTDAGQGLVENSRFILIVDSAVRALDLFFTAALHEPTGWELDVAFETFVRACALPCSGGQQ